MLNNPGKTIDLEKLIEPEAEDLSKTEVAQIYQAIPQLAYQRGDGYKEGYMTSRALSLSHIFEAMGAI